MIRRTIISVASVAVLCLADVALLNVAQAFDMGNMMNPSRWFDNDNDYYDRGYYGGYGPYGYGGGPYGYGGGPWGGGPYGYGGGPYGYGGGPWGGGYGGYGGGYPSTIVVNPNAGGNTSQQPAPPPRLPE